MAWSQLNPTHTLQLTSGYFCAGMLVGGDGKITDKAPILRYCLHGDTLQYVLDYAKFRNWKVTLTPL